MDRPGPLAGRTVGGRHTLFRRAVVAHPVARPIARGRGGVARNAGEPRRRGLDVRRGALVRGGSHGASPGVPLDRFRGGPTAHGGAVRRPRPRAAGGRRIALRGADRPGMGAAPHGGGRVVTKWTCDVRRAVAVRFGSRLGRASARDRLCHVAIAAPAFLAAPVAERGADRAIWWRAHG